jgi:hypothetical protein
VGVEEGDGESQLTLESVEVVGEVLQRAEGGEGRGHVGQEGGETRGQGGGVAGQQVEPQGDGDVPAALGDLRAGGGERPGEAGLWKTM